MSIQSSDLAHITAELHACLSGKLQRITQPSKEELLFQIRSPGQTHLLAIYLAPPDERLHLVETKPPSLPHPTAFCMSLRKHLLNKRLTHIEKIPGDRIIHMTWSHPEESFHLMVELLPRRANVLLCNEMHELMLSYQGVSATRGLRRGDVYEAPERPYAQEGKPTEDENLELSSENPFAFNQRIAQRFAIQTQTRRIQRYKQMALKVRRTELKKLRRLVQNLERDVKRCNDSLQREADGELLKHNLHLIQRGSTSIEVTDYYDPELKQRSIPLDPTLSPQLNLEKIFRKIKRARKGLEAIQPRLEATEYRLLELEEELDTIEQLEDEEQLLEWIPDASSSTSQKNKKQPKQLPYREYTSSDGKRIWVGKNSRNNDLLTFRVARGNDHWLHVRGIPGSHVVVPVERGKQPTTEQLIDAATLAAHFSKARGEIHVDVMHTQAKYVKKAKGAPPGQVSVLRDKNIALRIESSRLERLLSANEG